MRIYKTCPEGHEYSYIQRGGLVLPGDTHDCPECARDNDNTNAPPGTWTYPFEDSSGPDAGPELRHITLQGGFGPYVRHPVDPPQPVEPFGVFHDIGPLDTYQCCDIPLVQVAKRVPDAWFPDHAQVGICEHGYLAYGGPRALFWDALRFAHGDPGTGTDPDTHPLPLDAPGVDCAGEMVADG